MTEPVNLSEAAVVKAANAFCVTLRDGRLPVVGDHALGLYLDDCRHLRALELRLAGAAPRLLVSSDAAGAGAVFELTNPELALADGSTLALQSLRVRVARQMSPGGMVDQITLRSHAREPFELDLELRVDADFRPMLEVHGVTEPAEREVRRDAHGDTLTFSAVGLDGRERSTTVSCVGAIAMEDGRLRVPVALGPGEERTIEMRVGLGDGHAGDAAWHAAAEAEAWLAEHAHLEVDDELVGRVLRRSLLDLRLLVSEVDGLRYYAAGVPWYATLFGRDSIITALQAIAFDAELAEETLRLLAGRMGDRLDDRHDEEPGKILHELRLDELAAAGRTPLSRYYGTVDATPLFLCLICEHADWTGSLELFRELRPQVDRALRWLEDFGDLDGDGLLEYRCRAPGGLVNQGWKDSWDGVVDEHGDPLRAPIALVEAQGYAIAARRRTARLLELDGDGARAQELRDDALRLAGALERFWLEDRGYYSMALDGDKRASRALASNQGHLLWALAVPAERAAAIADALMSEGSYSGWGIRTLSANERAFNPVGYHTGTVWPHDNALTAVGLRKYGLDDAFLRIFDDLLDAAAGVTDYRLPELFAGFSRADYENPVPYPVACSPQAWAAASLLGMLVAGVGLVPDALGKTLRIRRPSLPRNINRLALNGLRIGDARVDLLLERVGDRPDAVALTDVRLDGDIEVVLEVRDPIRSQDAAPTLEDIQSQGAVGQP